MRSASCAETTFLPAVGCGVAGELARSIELLGHDRGGEEK